MADVFEPVAIVLRAITPLHQAFSVALVLIEFALVNTPICVLHGALPVLLRIAPFANVFNIGLGAFPFESSLAMDFVIFEVAFVYVALRESQRAVSAFEIVFPGTIVF